MKWLLVLFAILLVSCSTPDLAVREAAQVLNQSPITSGIYSTAASLPAKVVVEGDFVSFPKLKAVDPDGDPITYYFTSPLDAKGNWQTKLGDAGNYTVTITASNGKQNVSQDVVIVVQKANRPPVISINDSITVFAGETVVLSPVITDEDNDEVTVNYVGWMTSPTRDTVSDDVGVHEVTIVASDGNNTVSKLVNVVVKKVNHYPVLSVEDVSASEGDTVVVKPVVSDEDGDKVTVTYGSPLDENGQWATKEGDVGVYTAEITASDGQLNVTKAVQITVAKLNHPPVIEIGNSTISVNEGDVVKLDVQASDSDGDSVDVSIGGWMNSTTKQTVFGDAGVHDVTIVATDSKGAQVSTDVSVTVIHVKRPPVFDPESFI